MGQEAYSTIAIQRAQVLILKRTTVRPRRSHESHHRRRYVRSHSGAFKIRPASSPQYLPRVPPLRQPSGNFGVPGIPATYNYVIVDVGTAGLALARRLATNISATVAVN